VGVGVPVHMPGMGQEGGEVQVEAPVVTRQVQKTAQGRHRLVCACGRCQELLPSCLKGACPWRLEWNQLHEKCTRAFPKVGKRGLCSVGCAVVGEGVWLSQKRPG